MSQPNHSWAIKNQTSLLKLPRLEVIEDQVILPNGNESTYSKIILQPGVLIVPIKIENNGGLTFILVEQYRHPLGSMLLEFPGGAIDANEQPLDAARRELEEETGYLADRIRFLYMLHQLPSDSPSKTYVYLALVEKKKEDHTLLQSEADQGLVVREIKDEALMKMIRDNEIVDSKTLSALMVTLFQNKSGLSYLREMGKIA